MSNKKLQSHCFFEAHLSICSFYRIVILNFQRILSSSRCNDLSQFFLSFRNSYRRDYNTITINYNVLICFLPRRADRHRRHKVFYIDYIEVRNLPNYTL